MQVCFFEISVASFCVINDHFSDAGAASDLEQEHNSNAKKDAAGWNKSDVGDSAFTLC